jgi:hypothetical protein
LKSAALLAGLVLAGCQVGKPGTEAPVSEVRYQDIVVDQALYGPFDPQIAIHTCADESQHSLVLQPGERRTYELTLRGPSELFLGGCVDGPMPPGSGPGGHRVLRVRAFLPDGRWEELVLPMGPGWSQRRANLSAAGGNVRLRLQADLPAGTRAFVDTFALRSEVPADFREATADLRKPRRAILISLDAFREDAIGAIGGRTRTPVLDALIAQSERFFPHWAQEISTKPSHASMLTGLPVEVHGSDRGEQPLAPAIETLAERIAATGAATGAFMQIAPFFAEKFGLDQGFGTYRLSSWSLAQELRMAAEWASAHRESPSFLFVHTYAAHSDFGVLPYEASGVTRSTIAEKFGVRDYGCVGTDCASRRLLGVNYAKAAPFPREAEITRYLYDRGVETLDRELGVFFEDLRRGGLWDETLILVTADHGESFGEHGYYLHTTPHEEVLRVPLIVKWPRSARPGQATERPSTSLDLAPTLLAHFGLTAGDLPGHDLAKSPATPSTAMVSKEAVRIGDLKLLLATAEFPRALYDLALDPGETTNLLPGREADAARLERARNLAIAAARKRARVQGAEEPQPFTAEELEQLRSLGYL